MLIQEAENEMCRLIHYCILKDGYCSSLRVLFWFQNEEMQQVLLYNLLLLSQIYQ